MVQRYPINELGDKCPGCDVPWFIHGKGSQIDATAVGDGDAMHGAVSLYKCLGCGHEYEVEFPIGSIFLAAS